jgi:HrpA-like RNA helicase
MLLQQRRGRAGRVRPGISYHMYSSHTFQYDMQEYQMPEMLRVGLEDLVLQILVLDLGEPSSFLAKALNPPSALALKNSLKLLEGLGAVVVQWNNEDSIGMKRVDNDSSCDATTATSGLTALGFHLAALPVDPRVGKMMIYGALFGCTDPALTIAASMSARSPFMSPFDKRDQAEEARRAFATGGSDPLTTLAAFNQWKEFRRRNGDRATNEFLRDSFLSRLTLFQMEDLRNQFANFLVEIGFLPKGFKLSEHRNRGGGDQIVSQSTNINAENVALIKTIVCAGLYPNIIVAPRDLVEIRPGDKTAGEYAFQGRKGDVYLHPCTVSFKAKRLDSRYCCYQEIVKTSKIYVRDCTTVSPIALLLFGGSLQVFHSKHVVTVDQWLQFKIGARPATLVKYLRAQMESLLLRKILAPQDDVTGSKEAQALIQGVSTLLANEKPPELPVGATSARPSAVGYYSPGTGLRGSGRSGGGRGDRYSRGGGRMTGLRGSARSQKNR